MKKVIIINGPIGVGKSTVGKLLCKKLNKSETLDSTALRIAYNQRMDMLHVHMTHSLKKQTSVIKCNTALPEGVFANETNTGEKNINEIILYARRHNQNVFDNLKSVGLLMEVAI